MIIKGNLRAFYCGFFIILMISQAAFVGDNWPSFRGPSHDGISDAANLPVTWSETENIRWKTAIHDRG
jgi:outer membrane protein assembly factor BamB